VGTILEDAIGSLYRFCK